MQDKLLTNHIMVEPTVLNTVLAGKAIWPLNINTYNFHIWLGELHFKLHQKSNLGAEVRRFSPHYAEDPYYHRSN